MVLAPAANFRGKTKHQEATFPDVREKERKRDACYEEIKFVEWIRGLL